MSNRACKGIVCCPQLVATATCCLTIPHLTDAVKVELERLIGVAKGIEKLDLAADFRLSDEQRGALGDIADTAAEELQVAFLANDGPRAGRIARATREDLVFVVLEFSKERGSVL